MRPLKRVIDLARILGVKLSTVYTQVSQGKIPHIRIGRLVRFSEGQINDFLKRKTRGGFNLRSSGQCDPNVEVN